MSGDNLTILAGQNEAGKTAILQALQDFDQELGELPLTADYVPDMLEDAIPIVSVKFTVDRRMIEEALADHLITVHSDFIDLFASKETVWVHRDLQKGQYLFDSDLEQHLASLSKDTPEQVHDFHRALRYAWPSFLYFDSFNSKLPREISLDEINSKAKTASRAAIKIVEDFLELAEIEVEKVKSLSNSDKLLSNYLKHRTAKITGDFLTYWKQQTELNKSIELSVKHTRDNAGILKLAFFVHDDVDQYPEQRSKGFLWFLSFYLRLAAAQKREPHRKTFLLIDEPGTFLHARAQKDVLHLFEDRIAVTQQILYSTHSPFLIPPSKLHRLRIVLKTRSEGSVVIDRLTHPKLRLTQGVDALSPVIAAIGLDISEHLKLVKPVNVIVEGISDYFYLTRFAELFDQKAQESVNFFPGTGATTTTTLASLFIGWSLKFAVLLDRDDEGKKVAAKFEKDLAIPKSQIIFPSDAETIEDLFSAQDFKKLLQRFDSGLVLHANERPSQCVRRLKLDKVLLARKFCEGNDPLTKETQSRVLKLFTTIRSALALEENCVSTPFPPTRSESAA